MTWLFLSTKGGPCTKKFEKHVDKSCSVQKQLWINTERQQSAYMRQSEVKSRVFQYQRSPKMHSCMCTHSWFICISLLYVELLICSFICGKWSEYVIELVSLPHSHDFKSVFNNYRCSLSCMWLWHNLTQFSDDSSPAAATFYIVVLSNAWV